MPRSTSNRYFRGWSPYYLVIVLKILEEELVKIKEAVGEQAYNDGRYEEAAELFKSLIEQDEFTEFLTLPGYKKLA
ncbi:hypothetical protein MHB44_00895 [Lysinibacillus sp. FSL H8-0500]|uniref:hypothetical protein n=1 Tax=Lysinibacillus sp. FSL H8-0500 TaxID=2921393 RepID=UPI00310144CA